MTKKKQGGLAGISAGESAISTVGLGYGLNYRGYNIVDLSKHSSFEEVAYLLLKGELPRKAQLDQFCSKLANLRKLPDSLKLVIEQIPKDAHPMEVMRTICSFLGVIEPESKKNCQLQIAMRLIAVFGPAICYWWHFSHHGKRIETMTDPKDSIAANFAKLIL